MRRLDRSEIVGIGRKLGLDFDVVGENQWVDGFRVELEHTSAGPLGGVFAVTDDPETVAKIAAAHLAEYPDYYVRLLKLEKEAEEALHRGHESALRAGFIPAAVSFPRAARLLASRWEWKAVEFGVSSLLAGLVAAIVVALVYFVATRGFGVAPRVAIVAGFLVGGLAGKLAYPPIESFWEWNVRTR